MLSLLFAGRSLGASTTAPSTQDSPAADAIHWHPWSDDLFARAKREHKFVLLDLEAVWCHWCHVQDTVTYVDPKIISLIDGSYIAVKVDQDSRPDISNRYADFGWPATVVFNADGGEIVIRSGYIPPKRMIAMLEAIIADPTPGPSVRTLSPISYANESSLTPALRESLKKRVIDDYDSKLGGWGFDDKYVNWDCIEYELSRDLSGDAAAGERVRQTLNAGTALIDPVWGGVDQYSVAGDWSHPHYEKLMQFQAELMKTYTLAFASQGDPIDRTAAENLHRYINGSLRSPEGAYYVSQDADLSDGTYADAYYALNDAQRRAKGIPRVDMHLYARENGWAIGGLSALHQYTGDATALSDAIAAANWIIANRALPGGGFRHDAHDAAGPYLGDTLWMGHAFLDLYADTGDRQWLTRAQAAADFIAAHVANDLPGNRSAGLATAFPTSAAGYHPQPDIDENIEAVRFFSLLNAYTGSATDSALAAQAMRFLATPAIANRVGPGQAAGILLADRSMNTPALHVTIVGAKGDAMTDALRAAALAAPTSDKRIDWQIPGELALPNTDVKYPAFKSAVAFVCTATTCSSPIFSPEELTKKLNAALAAQGIEPSKPLFAPLPR